MDSITYNVDTMNEGKSLILENIRLINNSESDPNYLMGIADKFGQNAKVDFPNKVKSVEHSISTNLGYYAIFLMVYFLML